MTNKFDEFKKIIEMLRAPEGCPWDREQTHSSLKAACIEEAAEVVCGINIWQETGNADNLKEELGDLLLQVVMHAVIAEEEGLFTMDDVLDEITQKMIRRHPHVFSDVKVEGSEDVLINWEKIKQQEKSGKDLVKNKLMDAFEESKKLLDAAVERKRIKK